LSERVVNLVADSSGNRLDLFLASNMPEFSRSRLQGLIKDGFVKIEGEVVVKPSIVVTQGQKIDVRIPPTEPSGIQGEQIPLDIVFENDDLIIINKPAGMVVHPSAGHPSGTLVNAALGYDPDMEGVGGELRPGIVHRLDKDTSGLIVIAKNGRTLAYLQEQFKLRRVEKTYLALVDGTPPTKTGRIEASVGRDPAHRKQMAILPEGKGRTAVTEYKTLESFKNFTLLEVHPFTGRTHQIRLHLKLLGNPIVGDTVYGHKHPSIPISRQFLHATRLKINLAPNDPPRIFEAPLPEDLEQVLFEVRKRDAK
jgi:23S rRNA pseudouridine1911/1915/1917 synthase